MTTKAQLRKAALSLPEAEEAATSGLPGFSVSGRTFASLTEGNGVRLALDAATASASLSRCTITEVPEENGQPGGITIPLAQLNGMELNNLVFKSWLVVAPDELASKARQAVRGQAPAGPDALPANIGKPATRALLLAGITNLSDVAGRSEKGLLELHGVGPRAVRLLGDALRGTGRDFAP